MVKLKLPVTLTSLLIIMPRSSTPLSIQFFIHCILSFWNLNHLRETLFLIGNHHYNQTHHVFTNFQPTQNICHTLPTPPYSKDNLNFSKNFNFHFSDKTDDEYLKLSQITAQRNDVGLNKTPFRIRLKLNAQLQTQRSTKVTKVTVQLGEDFDNLL